MTWDEMATTWDDDPVVRLYSKHAFISLGGTGLRVRGARVLDFGCGTGLLTEQLVADAGSIVALDLSPAMIAVVKEKIDTRGWTNVTAVASSLDTVRSDPAFAERFDLIVASSVCAFVDDYPSTACALVELLAPRGAFVQWDWEFDPNEEEPYGLTRDQIDRALSAAGLSDVRVKTAFEVEVEGHTMRPLMGHGIRNE